MARFKLALGTAMLSVAVVCMLLHSEMGLPSQEHVALSYDMDDTDLEDFLLDGTDAEVKPCAKPIPKEDFMQNTVALAAYTMAFDFESLNDSDTPTLNILKELFISIKKAGKTTHCTASEYEKALARFTEKAKKQEQAIADQQSQAISDTKKKATRGLPRYLLQHLDHTMRCSKDGLFQTKTVQVADDTGMSYALGKRFAIDGAKLGLTTQPVIFDKWAVPIYKFEQAYQDMLARSPVSGVTCHGCVAFRATEGSAFGPRWYEQDKACHKKVDFDETGFCECGDNFYPPRLHKGHLKQSCSEMCSNADYKNLKKKPVVVSVRAWTGRVEGSASKQSPKVSFGSNPKLYTMEHLPSFNSTRIYEFQLENAADVADKIVHIKASSTDYWYFTEMDLAVGTSGDAKGRGKFFTLGPRRNFLLAKPYPPARNFAGNNYGDSLTLKPFTTTVKITTKTGVLPNSIPKKGLEPEFWVMGKKDHQWYYGGQLKLPATAKENNGTSVFTTEIRKDIGDVYKVKLKAKKGGAYYMKHFHVHTLVKHAGHVHEEHNMHPAHFWIASKPFKDDAFYSFDKKLPEMVLEINRAKHKWDGRTCGGTAPAKSKCKFPFTYNGKTYHTCTTAGKSKYESWCMTENPGTWAYCDCDRYTTWKGVAGAGEKCAFPFKLRGKWHYDCIKGRELSNNLKYPCYDSPTGFCRSTYPNGVCSIDTLYQGRWGSCQPRGERPTVANNQRYTNGQGPAKGGLKCVFPFFYKGQWIDNCIGDAYGGFGWCSLQTIMTKRHGLWGGCRPPRPAPKRYIRWPDDVTEYVGKDAGPDTPCALPFTYRGGTYFDCTEKSDSVPHGWCSIDKEFKGRWGACAYNGYAPQKPAKGARWTNGKGTVEKYRSCTFPFMYRGSEYHGCMGRTKEMPHGWCSTTQNFSNKWGACLPPGTQPPKQDCVLTTWSPWTRGDVTKGASCTVTQAGKHKHGSEDHHDKCIGYTTRVRSILTPAKYGGKPCATLPRLRKQKESCKAAQACHKKLVGAVSNALNGQPVSAANVSVVGNGKELWTLTDVDGSYVINHVPTGDMAVTFAAQGFIGVSAPVKLHAGKAKASKFLSMRPIPQSGDTGALGLTLNWGESPSDLDAHIIFAPAAPNGGVNATGAITAAKRLDSLHQEVKHFYWMNKGDPNVYPYITLDHDDMSGRGPETISIHRMADGHYHFYVKCYSCPPSSNDDDLSGDMGKSEATVTITQGSKQLMLPTVSGGYTPQYQLGEHAKGRPTIFWDVVSVYVMNGQAKLTPHLEYVHHAPSFEANSGTVELTEAKVTTPPKVTEPPPALAPPRVASKVEQAETFFAKEEAQEHRAQQAKKAAQAEERLQVAKKQYAQAEMAESREELREARAPVYEGDEPPWAQSASTVVPEH
jgi:hypothetical protein